MFNVLDPSHKVQGSFLIEASAGTGKTFAMEHLVVRALVDQEAPISLDQILLVTFTKAAAAQLRIRVQTCLRHALATIGSPQAPAYLQTLDDPFLARRQLRCALAYYDQAAIYTIHGFCMKMLQEHGEQVQGEEKGASFTLAPVLIDLLRSDRIDLADGVRVLRAHRGQVEGVVEAIERLIGRGLPIIPAPPRAILERQLAEACCALGISRQHFIEAFCHQASSFYGVCIGRTKEVKPFYMEAAEAIGGALEGQPLKESDLEGARELMEALSAYKRSLPKDPLLEQVRLALSPYLFPLTSADAALGRIAAFCQTELLRRIEQEGRGELSTLIQRFARWIERDSVAQERLQARYRLVMIDEFQDTDPGQWSLFFSLFQKAQLILVGDPKQSIYSFRSADIYTYLDAAEKMGQTRQLLTNHRSSQPLVEALNTLFLAAKDWLPLPEQKRALPYRPVEAARQTVRLQGPAIEIVSVEGTGKTVDEIEESLFFPYFLSQVRQLKEQKVALSSIAFLVRDHAQAGRLETFFHRYKLPTRRQKAIAAEQSSAFTQLRQLLEAILNPYETKWVKTALAGELFAWSGEALCGAEQKELWLWVVAAFLEARRLWFSEGLNQALAYLLDVKFPHSTESLLTQLLTREGGAVFFHQWRQIVDFFVIQEAEKGATPQQLLECFSSIEGTSSLLLRPPAACEAVQILTLHMSKGLEFEVVFALGVMNRTPFDAGFFPVRQEGHYGIQEVAYGSERYHQVVEEVDAEKARQLYVALTRAKERLYIPHIEGWKPPAEGKGSAWEIFVDKIEGSLQTLAAECPSLSIHHIEPMVPTPFIVEKPPQLIAPTPISLKVTPIEMVSFSSLVRRFTRQEKVYTVSQPLDAMPAGRRTGEALHRILQKVDFRASHGQIQQVVTTFFSSESLKGWVEPITEHLFKLFHLPLWFGGPSLASLDPLCCYREMEFLYPEAGRYVTGTVDLWFSYEGVHYLLDWKSHRLPSYTLEALSSCIQEEGYGLQAALYRTAIERYLGINGSAYGGFFFLFLRGFDGVHGLVKL